MNKRYFFLLTLLFAFLGGVKSYSINTNSGIVAKQIYQIRAKDANRGILYAGDRSGSAAHAEGHISTAGSSSYRNDKGYQDFASIPVNPSGNTFQQFAFIEVGGSYYLYSVGARALLCVSGGKLYFSTTSFESITLTACTKFLWGNYALLKFNSADKFLTFSNGPGHQHGINLQAGIAANTNDEGCALNIAKVEGATLSDDELFYAQNLIDNRSANPLATAENFLINTTATQVGYPKAPARATLQAAIDVYKPLVLAKNVTLTAYNRFAAALTTYLSDTDVNMPEDGKAYKIVAVHPNGKEQPLYYTGSAVGAQIESNISDIYNAYWVCHKTSDTENKYLFVNHNGFYLNWFCDDASKGLNATGVSTSYDADYNVWTLSRAITSGGASASVIDSGTTNETLFGCFQLNAKGSGTNYYYLIARYNGDSSAGTFHAGPANAKYYTASNNNTFTYKLVEVDYYNKVVFRSPATPDGKYYASIYLPYAATVPTGATAYLGTLNGSSIRLTDIQGSVIPKKTAVVMISENDLATQYIAPATEAGSVPSGVTNNFQGVLGSRVTQNSTLAYTYVLNGSFGNIGFYKYTADYLPKGRAFFEVVSSGVQGFLFDFEGSETTGINAAALSEGNTAKTYYDLSGRRIATPKNGLYICNGKKVYIK